MEENIVDRYRAESVSNSVAFTEFMLAYNKNSNSIYCFYEGQEDFSYYPIRIKNISSIESYKDFNCGGKENVIKVRDIIKGNEYYKTAKTGFFVDSDFDNYQLSEDIYVTPMYSIESLYVTTEVLENILISEFKFKRETEDLTKCIGLYAEHQQSFNDKTIIFNSWLSCQADYRNRERGSTRLLIDNRVKDIFEKIVLPDLSGVKDLAEIDSREKIQNIYSQSPEIDEDILNLRIEEFRNVKQSEVFRGKFLMKMLISFLSRLQSIFGQDNNPFEHKYTCNLRLETATGCSALSQYALTPACLKSYILSNLN